MPEIRNHDAEALLDMVAKAAAANPYGVNAKIYNAALTVGEDGLLYKAKGDETPAKPYGNVKYADPGYQDDKQKRYPLDTEQHVRAAWSYIHQEKNSALYTAAQLKSIEGRIKAAGKEYKIDFSADA